MTGYVYTPPARIGTATWTVANGQHHPTVTVWLGAAPDAAFATFEAAAEISAVIEALMDARFALESAERVWAARPLVPSLAPVGDGPPATRSAGDESPGPAGVAAPDPGAGPGDALPDLPAWPTGVVSDGAAAFPRPPSATPGDTTQCLCIYGNDMALADRAVVSCPVHGDSPPLKPLPQRGQHPYQPRHDCDLCTFGNHQECNDTARHRDDWLCTCRDLDHDLAAIAPPPETATVLMGVIEEDQ